MGTRADFYIGRGEDAEWIGSIAWDGSPDAITPVKRKWRERAHLFDATTEADYRARVDQFFQDRDDVTRPEQGWPWPWDDSHTTDYSYAFDSGAVYACCFGHRWYLANDPALNDDDTPHKETAFPNMTAGKNVTYGQRSGLLVIGVPK